MSLASIVGKNRICSNVPHPLLQAIYIRYFNNGMSISPYHIFSNLIQQDISIVYDVAGQEILESFEGKSMLGMVREGKNNERKGLFLMPLI